MKSIFKDGVANTLMLAMFALDAGAATVEKDENGLPKAWRVFPFGPVSLTKDGVTLAGEFTREHADRIIAHHQQKGEKIPLDCNHVLAAAAGELKVEERELIKMTGENHPLPVGFASLEKREDGLWISDVDWVPLGAELMKRKLFRYFSPVIRGLKDGNLRISSCAVTNGPAIDNLDAIAANAEAGTDTPDAAFVGKARELLGLGAESSPAAVVGAIEGLLAKVKNHDNLQSRVDKLEMDAESKSRQELIEKGLAEGKITNDMRKWAQGQDTAVLSAFLQVAPRTVPTQRINTGNLEDTSGDAVALTADDKKTCKILGISHEDFLETKKQIANGV
jgi:phage I-like protein